MGIHFDELPAEMRLHIFRLATIKVSQHEDTYLDYRPFEAVALYDRDWSSSAQRALDVKRTIVLVSKEWKKIATEMLYECVRVRHSTDSLIAALEGPLSEEPQAGVVLDDGSDRRTFDNGRWVRRIEISPEILDFDPFHPLPLLRILEGCPFAECIVRPCMSIPGGPGLAKVRQAFPTFPNIKRIEWWLPSSMPRTNSDAKEMVFPGFLGQLINHCPNLQYLTLSGTYDRFGRNASYFQPKYTIPYPNIQTIRVEGEDGSVPIENAGISLPGLRNLVVALENTPVHWIIQRNGHRVRTLEFIDVDSIPLYAQPSPTAKAWTSKNVFALCPNIEELCVSLHMGATLAKHNPSPNGVVLHALKCIRVKFVRNLIIKSTQLAVFVRDSLKTPALERVVLHGNEDDWRRSAAFPILQAHVERLSYVALEFAE